MDCAELLAALRRATTPTPQPASSDRPEEDASGAVRRRDAPTWRTGEQDAGEWRLEALGSEWLLGEPVCLDANGRSPAPPMADVAAVVTWCDKERFGRCLFIYQVYQSVL